MCRTKEILDSSGNVARNSIATVETRLINSHPHGFVIRGENIDNPVLLHLHGGPGQSDFFVYFREEFKKLEKLFTICYFEQRGAGKSYLPNIDPKTMTLDQLVEDAHAMANYLLTRFNKRKIFVLGHSWGTTLGSFLVNKYPENFYAYIGIGQMADQLTSEVLSLQFIKDEAQRRGKEEDIIETSKLVMPKFEDSMDLWLEYIFKERSYVLNYGGIFYGKDASYFQSKFKYRDEAEEYTKEEKRNFTEGTGGKFSIGFLWKMMLKTKFIRDLPRQEVPVFIFQGLHDYATAYAPVKEYYEKLSAPIKKLYTFELSAHCPHVEEYEKFEEIVKNDIIKLCQ